MPLHASMFTAMEILRTHLSSSRVKLPRGICLIHLNQYSFITHILGVQMEKEKLLHRAKCCLAMPRQLRQTEIRRGWRKRKQGLDFSISTPSETT